MKKETGYPSIDKIHDKEFSYFKRNPIIPNTNIYNLIYLLNIFNMKNIAIQNMSLNITYSELMANTLKMSRAFKELGIKKGDIITVCMNNTHQAVATFLAANKIGALTTFLNNSASKEEIKNYLNLFESPLFINYNKNIEYNKEIKAATKVKQIITLKKGDLYTKGLNTIASTPFGYNDMLSFNDLGILSSYYNKPIFEICSNKDDALILYTSGSSGKPKAVVLTNENVIASGIYIKNTINLPKTHGEKCLCFVPFKYPYGFATSVLLTMMCGRVVVLVPDGLNKENAKSVLPQINYYYGSPALLDVLKKIVSDDIDLSQGKNFVTGGDFFTSKTEKSGKEFFQKHNNNKILFCNGAGNAETVATWSSSVGTSTKEGTVGRILVGDDPIVVNPNTLEEVKYDEEGTLLLRGRNVFKGYYDEPLLTKKEMVNINGKEYYNTRTIGKLGKDRFFNLTGRESRFYILSDGNKVYCEKIQNFISLIDVVEECVVVGKPDDDNRYSGKVYIKLKDNILPDDNTRKHIFNEFNRVYLINDNEKIYLNPFEYPSSIDFVDNIILTEADKIDFKEYEIMAQEEYEREKNILKRVKSKQ